MVTSTLKKEGIAVSALHQQALESLRQTFPQNHSTNYDILWRHGTDESYHQPHAPLMVLFPETTDQVVEIVNICRRHELPIIPYGAGTSLEGHIIPLGPAISLDMSRMNKIIEIANADMLAVVEAGITHRALNREVNPMGLFFSNDPGADASLGGMAATRGSGTNAVGYGTMRENVLGMTVVTSLGTVIKTGSKAKKSATGYDLTHLFIGQEGTLGIITELIVKLHPISEAISMAYVQYDTIAQAVDTAVATIQSGMKIARIELMDEVQMAASIAYSNLKNFEVKPTLFFEFHGSATSVEEQALAVGEISKEFGGRGFEWATSTEKRKELWTARHNAYYAMISTASQNHHGLTTDVCVPISKLAEAIGMAKELLKSYGFVSPVVGHVGDGNFHMILLFDPHQKEVIAKAAEFCDKLHHLAIKLGGTCSGEHGVGFGKQAYLVEEHGREAIEVMKLIKRALDPDNILNPGKMLPELH